MENVIKLNETVKEINESVYLKFDQGDLFLTTNNNFDNTEMKYILEMNDVDFQFALLEKFGKANITYVDNDINVIEMPGKPTVHLCVDVPPLTALYDILE